MATLHPENQLKYCNCTKPMNGLYNEPFWERSFHLPYFREENLKIGWYSHDIGQNLNYLPTIKQAQENMRGIYWEIVDKVWSLGEWCVHSFRF